MAVTYERTFNINVEDKLRYENTLIGTSQGKTLEQFILLLSSNVQQREKEYNDLESERLANLKIQTEVN